MEKHLLHINCNAPNGETGSFTISDTTGEITTSVEPSCSYIFDIMKDRGFRYEAHDPKYPVGYFVKEL